jgi:cephalosporin hydroxylase
MEQSKYSITKDVFNSLFGKGPLQNKFELFNFMKFIEISAKVKSVCEIGVFRGGTTRFFMKLIGNSGLYIGIDSGERGYLPDVIEEFKNHERFYLIKGDSSNSEVVKESKSILNSSFVDLVFIDGNHQTEYVRKDFQNYKEIVNPGGFLAFHDLVNPGILPVWKEAQKDNSFNSVLETYGEIHPCGIGILQRKK